MSTTADNLERAPMDALEMWALSISVVAIRNGRDVAIFADKHSRTVEKSQ